MQRVFVVSGPSGVGKDTSVDRMLEDFPDVAGEVARVPSVTDREPRGSDAPGAYEYVDEAGFRAMEGGLVAVTSAHGHDYGMRRDLLMAAMGRGMSPVVILDKNGACDMRERLGDGAVLIYLLPPSMGELRRRIEGRDGESGEVERRMSDSAGEVEDVSWFDHVIVADDVGSTARRIAAIVGAELHKD